MDTFLRQNVSHSNKETTANATTDTEEFLTYEDSLPSDKNDWISGSMVNIAPY